MDLAGVAGYFAHQLCVGHVWALTAPLLRHPSSPHCKAAPYARVDLCPCCRATDTSRPLRAQRPVTCWPRSISFSATASGGPALTSCRCGRTRHRPAARCAPSVPGPQAAGREGNRAESTRAGVNTATPSYSCSVACWLFAWGQKPRSMPPQRTVWHSESATGSVCQAPHALAPACGSQPGLHRGCDGDGQQAHFSYSHERAQLSISPGSPPASPPLAPAERSSQ